MIRNIVFDVGKVLVSYEPEAMMKKLGFDEEKISRVNKAVFKNPLWEQADQGIYEAEEFRTRFLANDPDFAKEIEEAYNHVGDTIELYPYVEEWMKSLKSQGYHLYVLSNYGEYTYGITKHKMKFLPYMDGVVFSYRCKMIKPQAEIYEYLIDKFQINPAETVFLDDRPENIEAAQRAGIHGIVFTGYKEACAELEKLLEGQK